MTNKLTEFLKQKFQERKQAKQAKQRTTAYTDAVKKIKVLQIERKCVIDELTGITNFMSTTELMLGKNNVTTK